MKRDMLNFESLPGIAGDILLLIILFFIGRLWKNILPKVVRNYQWEVADFLTEMLQTIQLKYRFSPTKCMGATNVEPKKPP
jgi:hypothetical protein